jgi:phosphate:Na+ symporter
VNFLATAGMVAGGIGLLLVGMAMMTDGLKLAAGKALRNILSTWTNTRARGLAAGFLITGMVQSSSAVTVATIGFANAGLLTLPAALWVVYGSNVGTTMTGWIVALIGFKLKVEAFALPLVGLGVVLRLTGEGSRRAYFGQSIIGFGLLFLGIGVLADTFTSLGETMKLPVITEPWIWSVLVYIAVGMVLTTLMQSSSAALVIALSAAESGLIPLNTAALVVIGANLGTTTTAILSVWGATPTAKRVALGHVIFNLLTASVAVLIITPMLAAVEAIRNFLALEPSPAITLALFHTVFNVLGVALMWPISGRVERFLAGRFQTEEELESRPRYLDKNVLALPHIAVQALVREVGRIRDLTAAELESVLAGRRPGRSHRPQAVVQSLANAIGDYAAELSRTELPTDVSRMLPELLFSTQQLSAVVQSLPELSELLDEAAVEDPGARSALEALQVSAEHFLQALAAMDANATPADLEAAWQVVETDHELLRREALGAAAVGRLSAAAMSPVLRYGTLLRRLLKRTYRSSIRIASVQASLVEELEEGVEPTKSEPDADSELLA